MNKKAKFLIFLTILFALFVIFMFLRMGRTPSIANSVDGLIQNLKDEDSQVVDEARLALAEKGEPAVESLIEALKDKDNDVRSGAVYALGEIKDARAVEPLIEALKDENSDVRDCVAEALGKIKDARAVEPLIKALKDENTDIVDTAVWSLGMIGDKRAISPLIETLYDKSDEEIQMTVVWAIGNIAELTEEPLIEFLKDEELMVIRDFYSIFIDYNNPSTEAVLIKVLNTYGTSHMALCCVNCDNSKLVAAGYEWADNHGYIVTFSGLTIE